MSLHFVHPIFLLALIGVLAAGGLLARSADGRPSRWTYTRLLAGLLLVLALSQPQLGDGRRAVTVLVVDRSARVDGRMETTEAHWAVEARSVCPSPCRVVELADGASSVPDSAAALAATPALDRGASDLEQGVLLGLGLVPHGGELALLSGGSETRGDVLSAAAAARAAGVRIDTVALHDRLRRDAAITRLSAPASVRSGDAIPLLLTVRSTVAAHAVLAVVRDGVPAGRQRIALHAGDNAFTLNYTAGGTGWESFTASVALTGDGVTQNNSLSSVTDVLARPRVLVVDGDPSLDGLLTRLGFALTAILPAQMPTEAAAYRELDAVVLDDVPASSLGSAALAGLGTAVRDGGLGLVALGGPHSFSSGGYAHSPLQALLPLESLVPGNLQRRNVAIELVLDRSGSMIDLAGGFPKIEMVHVAGVQTTGFVAAHEDELGIVDFDAAAHLLVPIERVTPGAIEQRVKDEIEGLEPEGGTNIYLGLQTAFRQLEQSPAPSKHMVLITDGISDPENYAPLLAQIDAAHVSVATVALGEEADTSLLKQIAKATGGNYHATDSAKEIPQIFARESRFAAKPVQAHGSLAVLAGADSPVVASLSAGSLPALTGTEITNLKPGAQADLLAEVRPTDLVPALAQWQLGAGRVVAWTPGFGEPWAAAWSGESELWNDVVRFADRGASQPQPAVAVRTGTPPSLRVDLAGEGAADFGLSTLTATLASDTGTVATVTLERTAPSVYTAPLAGLPAGVYRYTLAAGGVTSAGELAVPYSEEYLPEPEGATQLGELAAATGGRVLSQGDPRALLAGGRTSLWWALALTALAAFLLGVFGELLGRPGGGDGGASWPSPPPQADGYEAMKPSERAPAASTSSGSTSVGAGR